MTDKMTFNKEMATEYDRGVRRTLPTYDSMFRLVQTYLRAHTTQQARILVVGAGGGTELATLGPTNPEWTFTAVDPAAPMLAFARMKADDLQMTDRVAFIEGTVDKVEADELHDAATCMLVLHFIPDIDEKRRQLQSIRQRLKPGAPFVLATMFGDTNAPEFDELVALWKAYWLDATSLTTTEMDDMENTIRQLSFLPEEDIVSLLQEAGFGSIAKFFTTTLFGGWICRAE